MPWQATDREKILNYLEVPRLKAHLDVLDKAMAIATAETITTVQDALTKLDTYTAQYETSLASNDQALIKADVVEWDVSRKGVGFPVLIAKYIQRIQTALALDFSTAKYAAAYTPLYRS